MNLDCGCGPCNTAPANCTCDGDLAGRLAESDDGLSGEVAGLGISADVSIGNGGVVDWSCG